MAGADSTVRVNIIGDAKSLQKAAGTSEGAFKGMGKQAKIAGGVIAGAFAADALLDFGQAALGEADRVGDASARLEEQLGKLSQPIIDAADNFSDLGASEGDILELTLKIADMGTAAGVADDALGPMALSAAESAAALALLGDADADTIVDQIGKAATGSEKALRALGISMTEAEVVTAALAATGKTSADQLTESELAAARYSLVLEKLAPRVALVTDGEADLEQQQAAVQAKFETLTGKIGAALEGPLNDLLSFILTGIAGWEMFAVWLDKNEKALGEMLGPLARVADALGVVIGLFQELNKLSLANIGPKGGVINRINTLTGRQTVSGSGSVTVQVQGGSPEAIETAVRRAINTATRHGS